MTNDDFLAALEAGALPPHEFSGATLASPLARQVFVLERRPTAS